MRGTVRRAGMSHPLVRGVATLALLWAPGAAPAQEEGRDLTLETMNDIVGFGDVAFSPTRPEILFTSDRSGSSKAWLVGADGSEKRLLVEDDGAEAGPVWSPDGERVAFLRTEGEAQDIWMVGRTGDGLRRLTAVPGRKHALAWSPDGARIGFLSDREGHQDVWLADVGSGDVRQLTFETNPPDETRWQPAWSPDGGRIAYVSNRSGVFEDDLWVVDVETGETEKLTSYLQVVSTPIWSPDGRWIAFNTVERDGLWYHEMSDIHVLDVAEGRLRKLPLNGVWVSDRFSGYRMAWSPDSRSILFRYEWEGDANLWRVPVEGGIATKVTYGEGRFGNFSVSGDGEWIAYARSTPTRAEEIYRVSLAGGPPLRITDWNPPYAVRAPRKTSFRSVDGLRILGYLYLPPDFDPSRRYPALVQVHGGGNNAYGNGFHVLEHLFSHRGYVILAVEYRGSAGHGRAFQDLSLGEFGAEQGWDAVAAARWLRSRPYTNGRVGIYGGSYGGIMSMAAVTRDPEPFDAAAPLYGIYDWSAAFETADRLARLMIIKGHRGFTPAENPELYEHTSSIRHLDRIDPDLPFLIMHGELDRRAPYGQSVMLAEALEDRGNPVEFHSFPDEHHGFRNPENRERAYGRLLEFFDEHLRTPGQGDGR